MTNRNLRIPLLSFAFAAGAAMLVAGETPVTRLMQRTPLTIISPVVCDSVNASGEKFDPTMLIGEKVSLDINSGSASEIKAGKENMFTIRRPKSGTELVVLQTNLRASDFAKAKLKVTSPAVFEVFIDNESKAKKMTFQDSISDASTSTIDLRMEPEKDYRLTIKMLVSAEEKADPTLSVALDADKKYDKVGFTVAPDSKMRFSLANTVMGPRINGVHISPDGKYLLTTTTDNYDYNRFSTSNELTEIATGKVVASNLKDAQWMPRGSRLYYSRKAKEGYDIVVISVPSMQETVIARGVPESNFEMSPNEDYIVYYHTDNGIKEEGPLRRYTSPDDRIVGNRTRQTLKMYDFKTGAERTLTFGNVTTSLNDISSDGSKLLITTMRETPTQWPFYSGDIIQLDINTMKVDTLVKNEGALYNAIYSPDAKEIFIVAGPASFGKIGENSGHEIPNDFDHQGFILNIATGNVRAMTRDFDPSLEQAVWNAADGRIYMRASKGFGDKLFVLDPKSGKITQLPGEIDNTLGFSIGRNESRYLAYYGQGYTYAGKAYMLNLNNGKNTLIGDPYAEQLSKVQLGKVEPYNFTSSDGTIIEGQLCYPPDFDASKKYPLIVYYYGGTSPSEYGISNPYTPQLFASRDYMVYVINPSGTTGYGQEFSARHVNAWGKRTAEDIIEGTKKVVKDHNFIDGKKIGCLGASYGGFMTQYLQTLTDIFAAAVSHAGISNVTSYWGEGYWGYSYNAVAAAKSYPWSDPELFTKQGSLFNADKIHTPLLLLHGNVDTNVPMGESIQIFNALRVLGREVEFISVDDQNHFIADYPKRQLWQNTIMAWFAKWLKDDPAWWDDLYPEPTKK